MRALAITITAGAVIDAIVAAVRLDGINPCRSGVEVQISDQTVQGCKAQDGSYAESAGIQSTATQGTAAAAAIAVEGEHCRHHLYLLCVAAAAAAAATTRLQIYTTTRYDIYTHVLDFNHICRNVQRGATTMYVLLGLRNLILRYVNTLD